jgi:hypothetical protein
VDRLNHIEFLLSYGNHKSASTQKSLDLATTLIHVDVIKQHTIPIPKEYVSKLVRAELCPLGIAHQFTINASGDIVDKNRACHDHTFHSTPSSSSVNLRPSKLLLEDCPYGQCFHRSLHHVHFLRLKYPGTPIVIVNFDLDSAYRRMTCAWHLAIQCICMKAEFAFILIRLAFRAAAAPSEFCVVLKWSVTFLMHYFLILLGIPA